MINNSRIYCNENFLINRKIAAYTTGVELGIISMPRWIVQSLERIGLTSERFARGVVWLRGTEILNGIVARYVSQRAVVDFSEMTRPSQGLDALEREYRLMARAGIFNDANTSRLIQLAQESSEGIPNVLRLLEANGLLQGENPARLMGILDRRVMSVLSVFHQHGLLNQSTFNALILHSSEAETLEKILKLLASSGLLTEENLARLFKYTSQLIHVLYRLRLLCRFHLMRKDSLDLILRMPSDCQWLASGVRFFNDCGSLNRFHFERILRNGRGLYSLVRSVLGYRHPDARNLNVLIEGQSNPPILIYILQALQEENLLYQFDLLDLFPKSSTFRNEIKAFFLLKTRNLLSRENLKLLLDCGVSFEDVADGLQLLDHQGLLSQKIFLFLFDYRSDVKKVLNGLALLTKAGLCRESILRRLFSSEVNSSDMVEVLSELHVRRLLSEKNVEMLFAKEVKIPLLLEALFILRDNGLLEQGLLEEFFSFEQFDSESNEWIVYSLSLLSDTGLLRSVNLGRIFQNAGSFNEAAEGLYMLYETGLLSSENIDLLFQERRYASLFVQALSILYDKKLLDQKNFHRIIENKKKIKLIIKGLEMLSDHGSLTQELFDRFMQTDKSREALLDLDLESMVLDISLKNKE